MFQNKYLRQLESQIAEGEATIQDLDSQIANLTAQRKSLTGLISAMRKHLDAVAPTVVTPILPTRGRRASQPADPAVPATPGDEPAGSWRRVIFDFLTGREDHAAKTEEIIAGLQAKGLPYSPHSVSIMLGRWHARGGPVEKVPGRHGYWRLVQSKPAPAPVD
jgi:uncharacterized coiled-coil protein SlyX